MISNHTKMKKNILYVTASLCVLCSCNSFLDTYPTESYSDQTVWSSQGTVDAFVVGNYDNAFNPYQQFSTWDRTFSNNMLNSLASCPSEARGLMENTYDWGLNSRFTAIRNCNIIIEKVAESSVLDNAYKKAYTAEAKLMRAMIYFDLARKGGRFIWVVKVLNIGDEFNIPLTKDMAESYSLILKDLREAIPDMTENHVPGRLDKNSALALLSEVCLTAAAYTDDATSLQNGKSLYQEAVDAVNMISGVSLDHDYESMFNQKGAYSSPEIILAKYWSADNTTVADTDMIDLIPNLLNSTLERLGCGPLFKVADIFECWCSYSPSQNLVDDYLVIDSKTGKAERWNETSQFVENTKKIPYGKILGKITARDPKEVTESTLAYELTNPDLSISDLMYKGRDKRFDASILHDGSTFLGETLTMNYRGNASRWAATPLQDESGQTNYLTRKYIYTNMSPRPFYNVYTDYHKIIFRYGKALLNKAEALLRLGNVMEAVAVMNQTRTVHGGLPGSEAATLQDAWNDYRIERRVELFYEGDWYFSLLRWGKYGKEANDGKSPGSIIDELAEPATFIEINADRNAVYVGKMQYQNDLRHFDTRSYLFPITKSVINANSAISDSDQNPGWE